jgi:V/A-type H+-transporting ATPase subunit A
MTNSIKAVYGNMVTVEFDGHVMQNAVAYCARSDGTRLKAEVIRVRGTLADMQVFEDARGLKVGDTVTMTDELLSAELGPGLLGQVYDGLQNPLNVVAAQAGFMLQPGLYCDALDRGRTWAFTPVVKEGDTLRAGDPLGTVPEGIFAHRVMVPFSWTGDWRVVKVASPGAYPVTETVAELAGPGGEVRPVTMVQRWPVKRPICVATARLLPTEPMVTRARIIDTMFPVVRGGTYCIPGPFGAGKTVLQQLTARYADIDIVVIAACGERAGEVVETLREFPDLPDPRTGKTLMERTIIICNTSAMPVAAREASVYTAVTLAEYYRQMGLSVLLLADSTSRWAQALREMSGRLEEIPGEEAFPAYLESRIAEFYERAGVIRLRDGSLGSVTVGGTVSPAGGNFEEPVTQATLKVVGAFHGLSRSRSDARRFPSIDPLDSWSTYQGIIDQALRQEARAALQRGHDVNQMMTVVGEEGTSMEDFVAYLKAELLDAAYLQQNGYDAVDAACPAERQRYVFAKVMSVLRTPFSFADKDQARTAFFELTDLLRNWNYAPWDSPDFKELESKLDRKVEQGAFRAA